MERRRTEERNENDYFTYEHSVELCKIVHFNSHGHLLVCVIDLWGVASPHTLPLLNGAVSLLIVVRFVKVALTVIVTSCWL